MAALRNQRDYSPAHWTQYFDEAHDVSVGDNDADSFRVYLKNFQHPLAPERQPGTRLDPDKLELSSDELSAYSRVPTLVLLHGGGYSALTWAQFAKHIDELCQCRLMAIDLRSHGDTKTEHDELMDIDTLVADVVAVTHSVHQQICAFAETPKIVLIGHSMGGAIAINCASKHIESLPSLAGFVVIDVVEGTAKEALPVMMSVIKMRPTKFGSLSLAIEWSVRSGMAKNTDAARVSMPGNLLNIAHGHLAIHDVPLNCSSTTVSQIKKHKFQISKDQLIGPSPPPALLPQPRLPQPPRVAHLRGNSATSTSTSMLPPPVPRGAPVEATILEEPTNDDDKQTTPQIPKSEGDVSTTGYGWRTNLSMTQPFWNGWFDNLSAQMLDAPVQGKFLLLAGIDRLDKTLTIGHMQGKFMMKVLPKCGHAVHEDVPEQVALAIGDFLVRNKFATAVDK